MNYTIFFATIIAWFATSFVLAQTPYTLKGKIYDAATQEPIIAATIQIANTEKGTISDADGNFELIVVQQDTPVLRISMLGYETQTIVCAQSSSMLRIALPIAVQEIQNVVVTANREASLRTQAPIAISKLSPKLLDETKATSIYEALNKTPGVLMVNLNNEQHSMSIRQPMTTSSYYLYMEDGIGIRPLGVFNHNALLEINQFTINSVEIVKGTASSLYGAEAVGGVVNFLSHRPTAVPTAKIGVQFDQWGYRRLQVGGGAQFGKFGFYVGGLTSQQRNSWMASSDYDKTSFNARLEYHFTPKTRLIATAMYGKYYSQMSGSVDSIAFYSRQYVSTSDFTYRKSEASRSRITLEHDWSNVSKTFITLFNRYNRHGQNPTYAIRWSSGQTTARGEINSNDFESYGILAQHSQRFDWLKSKLVAGAMHDFSPNRYWSYQVDLYAQLRADGRSVEKYTINRERPDIKLADYKAQINNSAIYVQYDVEPVQRLRVSLGGRWDRMAFSYNNFLDSTSGNKSYSQATGKAGLTYDLGKDKGLYANVSQGFAPPALTAIFRKKPNTNPTEFYYNLAPARFFNVELGGWASFFKHKLYIDVAIYQMNGKNELLSIRQADNSYDYQSAGRTLHRGIEMGLTFKPTDEFFFRWGGTTALHRFDDFQISNRQADSIQNLSGFEMPASPRWVWNTEFSYYPKWFKNFRASLEWQHVAGWYQNQINTVRYKGYDLVNLRAGYQWKGIELYINAMNITDELYATSVSRGNGATDRSTFTPAAPRTLVVGLQYSFVGKK